MSGQINKNPSEFKVEGNLAPSELSNPSSVIVYTPSHASLSILAPVVVDGHLLKPVKMVTNW